MPEEATLVRLTRRACLRLTLLAASGLSLLPGCRSAATAPAAPAQTPPDTSLLARWARLGRIWREMSAHIRRLPAFDDQGEAGFAQLKAEMQAALDALPAWPELRAMFEERWEHIQRSHYVAATCYDMVPGGPVLARGAIEEQVSELGRLLAEGKLTEEAARKAAAVLAIQAEYLVRLRDAEAKADPESTWEAWEPLRKQYQAGQIEARPAAELAGKRLTELTVDNLGWLAGPPKQGEGTPETSADVDG